MAELEADRLNASNPCAGRFGAFYSFYMEREHLSYLLGRLFFGIDSRPIYASLSAIADVLPGGVVLDVPCGGGIALRGIRSGQDVRYLALDLDPRMLQRTEARASSRGCDQVETMRAAADAIPLRDATADLFICHGGLHCYRDPAAALREAARCLRPGGRLIGSTFLSPGTRRQRLLSNRQRRRDELPPLWEEEELASGLTEAGFPEPRVAVDRGHAMFDAEFQDY